MFDGAVPRIDGIAQRGLGVLADLIPDQGLVKRRHMLIANLVGLDAQAIQEMDKTAQRGMNLSALAGILPQGLPAACEVFLLVPAVIDDPAMGQGRSRIADQILPGLLRDVECGV